MESTRTYWKAGERIAAICRRYSDARAEQFRSAKLLAKKYGANTRHVLSSRGFYSDRVTGFIFADESKVDTKAFRKCKYVADGWLPRLGTKAGRAIDAELKSLDVDTLAELIKALGINCFTGDGFFTPGIREVGGDFYITLRGNMKPRGCKRISDLRFERIAP